MRAREIYVVLAVSLAAIAACEPLRGKPGNDLVVAAERVLSPFEASSETKKILGATLDAARSLDAARLFATLPGSGAKARSILFEARQMEGRRVLRHEFPQPIGDLFDLRGLRLPTGGGEPGDGVLVAGVLPLQEPHGRFRLRLSSSVATGAGDLFAFWRALPRGLRILERAMNRKHEGKEISIFTIADLGRDFPRTSDFAVRYLDFRAASRSAERRGREIELRLRARLTSLAADYPRLAAYVTRMARSARGEGVLKSDGGAVLATWSAGDPEEGLTIAFSPRDGRLVPESGSEPAVDVVGPLRLRLVYSGSVERYGLKTTVEGLHGIIRTDPSVAPAQLSVEIAGEPTRLSVEGAFLGVVPVEAVDLLIPGNLEGVLRSIFAALLLGRDGRGIDMLTEFRAESSEKHQLSSGLVADVPSGELARTAMRLGAAAFRPGPDERSEALRFGRELVDRLREDLSS